MQHLHAQIGNHAFGQNENLLGARIDARQELAAFANLRQVELHALEFDARRFARKLRLFEGDDLGIVDLDPGKRGRKLYAVRARVEPGAEVDDGVDPLGHGSANVVVDDRGADRDGPRSKARPRHRLGDAPSVLSGKHGGERIMEERIGARCFDTPMMRNPEGRIRDVLDQSIRHA